MIDHDLPVDLPSKLPIYLPVGRSIHVAIYPSTYLGVYIYIYNPHPLSLGFGGGGRKMVTYNKRGGGEWKIVSYIFFGPKKVGGGRGG